MTRTRTARFRTLINLIHPTRHISQTSRAFPEITTGSPHIFGHRDQKGTGYSVETTNEMRVYIGHPSGGAEYDINKYVIN